MLSQISNLLFGGLELGHFLQKTIFHSEYYNLFEILDRYDILQSMKGLEGPFEDVESKELEVKNKPPEEITALGGITPEKERM